MMKHTLASFQHIIIFILLSSGLVACTTNKPETETFALSHVKIPQQETPQTQENVNNAPTQAQVARENKDLVNQTAQDTLNSIVKGTATFIKPTTNNNSNNIISKEDGTILNFVDADIQTVIKAVLSDMLGYNYFIDPSIQGTITLSTSRPLATESIIPTLENILQAHGMALVYQNDMYRILELGQASRVSKVDQTNQSLSGTRNSKNLGQAGYASRIFSLRYISATDIQSIIATIIKDVEILYTDDHRNLIIIAGNGPQLSAVQETVDMFDVNWLKGLSYAVLHPKFAEADTLISEINDLFQSGETPLKGLVKLIAIPRINAILAIANQHEYLKQIKDWVGLLDRELAQTQRILQTYAVQHSKASELADILNKIYENSNFKSGYGTPQKTQTTHKKNNVAATLGGKVSSDDKAVSSNSGPIIRRFRPKNPTSSNIDKRPSFIADERSNILLILATPEEHETIRRTIDQLDIAPDQVLIEATIVEVNLTDQLRYGVQWFFESGRASISLSEASTGAVSAIFPGFAYTFSRPDMNVALNALASLTQVKVISSPKLIALNNRTARLQVGDEIPIATQASVSSTNQDSPIVNTIEYKDTGVILEVTPRISANGNVILEVLQEVSDVVETTASGIDSPTIQQRKVKSTVIIESGKTVALGGLIRDNRSDIVSGVPLLQDIPVFGELFKSTAETTRQTELLVFITPTVARNTQEAQTITEQLRRNILELKQSFHLENKNE